MDKSRQISEALDQYLEEWDTAPEPRQFVILTLLASNLLYIRELIARVQSGSVPE